MKERDEAGRGAGESMGKGRGYDPLDNSPMFAGLDASCH